MKASMRMWSRFAFLVGVGIAPLVACSSDTSDPSSEEKRTGTLSLALQATAPSGNIYQLRNAFFQVTDARNNEPVDFLSSESGPPNARELSTLLLTGNYTVTLLDGWFIELVGSGPPPGNGGFGGTIGAGGQPSGFGGTFGTAGGKAGGPVPAAMEGFAGFDDGSAGETSPPEGGMGSGGFAGVGGTGVGGTGVGGGGGGGQRVDAQLLSDELQFFSLFGGDEAFVNYQFKVGEEIIDFNRGKLTIGISIIDDARCNVPDDVLQPQRVLLETNADATSQISLSSALGALASNGGRSDDPFAIFQQIYDSYATADQARLPDAIHCGDEQTNGLPSLNGYPIECNRIEHNQIDFLDFFFATAFVNRLDLAPENGAHCGQQRVIFASNAQNRAFIIMEAQIPNPTPELGIAGCRPLAQFWLDQNAIDDPLERGARLAAAFTSGHPQLQEAGFGPFFTATNLTVGSGQIRTNQFDQFPWTLREFKLALDGDALTVVPFPVAEAPHGALWNEDSGLPQGEACRENFLSALDGLLTSDPAQMSFVVDAACKDAESRNDFSQDYSSQLSAGFRATLDERLFGTGLSADDIANRAQFAGSCIGCHNEANGKFLGQGVFAPFANDFVHVSEFAFECANGEPGGCFPPSQALTQVFLPSRLQVLANVLEVPIPPNPCDGSGGSTGFGGASSFGGTFTAGTSSGGNGPIPVGGSVGTAGGAGEIDPAPQVDIVLPSAAEPVEQLQAADAEIREGYGDKTLSGRSAQSTH